MAAMASLTGGGGLSVGGGGPSESKSTTTSGIYSDFNVTFGGGKTAQLAPYIAIAAVVLAWLYFNRKK